MANTTIASDARQLARRLISLFPWIEFLMELLRFGRKVFRGWAEEGMYEVVEYTSTLELLDTHGERALVRKHERVKYLQDNIIAYQDQAWGDGDILINYRCSPGVPVDQYRPGKKTYILISLREIKNRGDIDEFNIEWEIQHGFLRPTELWDAEINHRMKVFKLQVIFPHARPPVRVSLIEDLTRKTSPLGDSALVQLPDGRWLVSWESHRPRFHETYSLKWDW